MSDNGFHPLVYFWLAYYRTGECLPQFDFQTGEKNDFKNIEQDKLEKFGLIPFPTFLAIKVNIAAGKQFALIKEGLTPYIMVLGKDQRLIYCRRNYIHSFIFQYCEACEYKWQWSLSSKGGEIGDVDLPIYPNHISQEWQDKKFLCVQCPKCGVFNAVVCPDCKDVLINEMKKSDSEEHYFQCPKCKKEFPRYIKSYDDIVRKAIYLLGHQTTIEGKNKKQIIFINEDGTFELNEDFDYK